MTAQLPLLLVVGPSGHGVVQYGADVASALIADGAARVEVAADPTAGRAAVERERSVHVHVTDRIFGDSPEAAAAVIEEWAALCRLTITVHDVPQPSDGKMFARRVAAYHRMASAAEATALNSAHEQHLWREHIGTASLPAVIPLGARIAQAPGLGPDAAASVADLVVLLAGFVYPGKGHRPAITAAAAAAAHLRAGGGDVGHVVVRAIGAPSRGHESDVDALRADAEALGVELEVTGFLADDAFAQALQAPGIPLAAHEHVSASRSMLDWVEVGRRPLVVDSRYAREMAELRPGTLSLYGPAALPAALADAWLTPSRTWQEAGTALAPTLRDAAAAYAAWWQAP
ncbi:hypothetical protein [Microbacterium sp.]|uniref:hypothetical protein n=1 Tax=Microbacterium sp. TaxID=51671 RepID=UPI003735069A